MENKKLKMSGKKFRRIWASVIAVVVVFAIGATIACNVFSQSLDTYVGRGARKVTESNMNPISGR